MGLNQDALKNLQKDLETRTSGFTKVFYASKISKPTLVRLLPPHPNMGGVYFTESIQYCLNKSDFYMSLETFDGMSCPITEELDAAKESGDADLEALAKKVKKSSEYKMSVLIFKDLDSYELIPNNPFVLSCGSMLTKAINKVVTHRHYQPDITDILTGFCIELDRTGSGLDTNYSAAGDKAPSEMPAEFYKDPVDLLEMNKKAAFSERTLRAVIREYLYGEAIPMDCRAELDSRKKKDSKAPATPAASAGQKRERFNPDAEAEDPENMQTEEQEEKPKPAPLVPKKAVVAGAKPAATTPPKTRRITDELNDLD